MKHKLIFLMRRFSMTTAQYEKELEVLGQECCINHNCLGILTFNQEDQIWTCDSCKEIYTTNDILEEELETI